MDFSAGETRQKTLVVVLGPTAIGKTRVGVRLARYFDTVVLSADSRQFYREMKIGTALPEEHELEGIPHYFLSNLSIHDDFNVYEYEKQAIALLDNLFSHHDIVLMVGGSGLYIDAVVSGIDDLPDANHKIRDRLNRQFEEEGLKPLQQQLQALDPEYYEEVDLNNPNRIIRALEVCIITGGKFSSLRMHRVKKRNFITVKAGLALPREELFRLINDRVDQMVKRGLLDEVGQLYPLRELNAMKTVGYKELIDFMDGKYDFEQAVEKIKTNTRRYAKRQITWFKRDGSIKWFRPDAYDDIVQFIENKLGARYNNQGPE